MTDYPALHMIIDGERVSGGGRRTFDVVNPVTGEAIGALPLAEAADLDRALEVAKKGFAIWRKSTAQDRAAVLTGAARLMLERADDLATLLSPVFNTTSGLPAFGTNTVSCVYYHTMPCFLAILIMQPQESC